jgi:hypothetical protein
MKENSSKQEGQGIFRCPFELKARAENTILEVALGENKIDRLRTLSKAYTEFRENTEMTAAVFSPPKSLLRSCKNNEELREAIIPYQAEMITIELETLLYPFLPYQIGAAGKEVMQTVAQQYPEKLKATIALLQAFDSLGFGVRQRENLITWFTVLFKKMLEHKDGPQTFVIREFRNNAADFGMPLLEIHPEFVVLTAHRDKHSSDRRENQNLISVVKSPFYPQQFGRYADTVEIWLNRESDFFSLSTPTRKNIRRASNTVLKAGGISIDDVEEDKQKLGVWVPEFIVPEKSKA